MSRFNLLHPDPEKLPLESQFQYLDLYLLALTKN